MKSERRGRGKVKCGVSLANIVFAASLLTMILVEAKSSSFSSTQPLCPTSFAGKVVEMADAVTPVTEGISKIQITFQVAPSNEMKTISVAQGSIEELQVGDKVSVSMRDQWLCSLQKL